MKIVIAQSDSLRADADSYVYSCYPDSCLIRNNDDFYIPNFSSEIIAYFGVYVSIHKVGKHIAPEFIHRYIKSCGVAINFIAADTERELHARHQHTDIARGFDNSFAISKPIELPPPTLKFACQYKDYSYSIAWCDIVDYIHKTCAHASTYYTLKIGDIFFMQLWQLPFCMEQADTITGSVQAEPLLYCKIQ